MYPKVSYPLFKESTNTKEDASFAHNCKKLGIDNLCLAAAVACR